MFNILMLLRCIITEVLGQIHNLCIFMLVNNESVLTLCTYYLHIKSLGF